MIWAVSMAAHGNPEQPTKVYFSTVVRSAPLESGGEFVLLDWQTKTIEARAVIYPTNPEIDDPNPRGNARGARGVGFVGDHVVVASYHTLKVYDRELRHQRDISHPLMVGLHEVYVDGSDANGGGRIWVASTSIDAVLVIDCETGDAVQQYWPREMPGLQRELGLTPLPIDKKADNRTRFLEQRHAGHPSHLHLNAITTWRGETYALFNAPGVIANLDRDEVTVRDRALRHGHNLVLCDGTAMVNDTFGRAVRAYDLHRKAPGPVIKLDAFRTVRAVVCKHQLGYLAKGVLKKLLFHQLSAPRPIFVRGLDMVGDLLFVGISPAAILCIDRRTGELVDSFRYSDDVAVCVHGLKVLAE
jgi:hypothetical protein